MIDDFRIVAKKPPLGLVPRWVRDRERMCEIIEAMLRYANDNKQIPQIWIDELQELNNRERNPI